MTLKDDCINYVRKCHKCQVYADKIHVSPTSLHVMVSPWPFLIWSMDVIRPITLKASNDHRFIFVIIDYFIKWVEAVSYVCVTKSVVAHFIKREIICRYRLSKRNISDNGLNLKNDVITEICTRFKTKHHNSIPYRPKMNGAVEVANKNVKKIIAKATKTCRDWHEKPFFALHVYRTDVQTSTGATSYSLVYVMDAVLPIKVEIPLLRVLSELELEKAEWVQARYEQLNLIEEKMMKTICHGQLYQKRMMRAHDKKIRPR